MRFYTRQEKVGNWHAPSVGRAPVLGLAADVRVLVLVSELEAQVVHHVADVFHDVSVFTPIPDDRVATEDLEGGDKVGVGGGSEATEDAQLGQEVGPGADRQQRALAAGVVLLQLRIGCDEVERLGLRVQDILGVAAEDDEDIEVVEALVGLLPRALGANEDALLGEDLRLAARKGDLEGLGSCFIENPVSTLPRNTVHTTLRDGKKLRV